MFSKLSQQRLCAADHVEFFDFSIKAVLRHFTLALLAMGFVPSALADHPG